MPDATEMAMRSAFMVVMPSAIELGLIVLPYAVQSIFVTLISNVLCMLLGQELDDWSVVREKGRYDRYYCGSS